MRLELLLFRLYENASINKEVNFIRLAADFEQQSASFYFQRSEETNVVGIKPLFSVLQDFYYVDCVFVDVKHCFGSQFDWQNLKQFVNVEVLERRQQVVRLRHVEELNLFDCLL